MARDEIRDASEVERLSLAALEHAARHATPPTPMIYEIWYHYAAGRHAALNEQVDKHVAKGEPITFEFVHRLHDRFFSDVPLRRGLSYFGAEIAAKIADIQVIVETNENDSSGVAKSLNGLAAKIARQTSATQLSQSAEKLSALTAKQLRTTQALTEELSGAREEIIGFRQEIERLQRLCETDHLTKISNRRHFDERLSRTLEAVKADDHKACLAIADIDFFKKFNDTHGHMAGDRVLVKFAEILRKTIRTSDLAARLGGEEFALVLENCSLNKADALCNEIRDFLMRTPFADTENRQRSRVTASFGVTALRPEDDAASALARADSLLYDAKSMGRNMVISGV